MDKALLITLIIAVAIGSLRGVHYWATHRRPKTRTSAQQRLIDLNPMLAAANVRWNVAARRIRIGWPTKLAVAVAVLVAIDRPIAH